MYVELNLSELSRHSDCDTNILNVLLLYRGTVEMLADAYFAQKLTTRAIYRRYLVLPSTAAAAYFAARTVHNKRKTQSESVW